MLRSRRLALGIASLAFVFVTTLPADEPKGDLKKMQGAWTSKDDSGEATWTFQGDRLSLKAPGREYEITIKLDEAAKPEKVIDLDVLESSPNAKGTKSQGIYKFDGEDKLTICFGPESRPKDFDADFMSSFAFELTRNKK
jgi:uncharacterized protein (TIGR03067 family)